MLSHQPHQLAARAADRGDRCIGAQGQVARYRAERWGHRSRAHARAMTDVIIYHNPACGTSRNTLAMIRNAGIEPHVVEYLKTQLVRALLVELIARAGLTPRALLREKGTPYADLHLDDAQPHGRAPVREKGETYVENP